MTDNDYLSFHLDSNPAILYHGNMTIVYLIAGLGLLTLGGEWLVRGSSRLAAALGISPLAIGLTIVAFGTSSPELVVSVQAALHGQPDIALGNVIGSNIFNILFILGLCAIVAPLVVTQKLIRVDVPIMVAASLMIFIQSLDRRLSFFDGLVLTAVLAGYTVFVLRQKPSGNRELSREYEKELGPRKANKKHVMQNAVLIVLGLALLVLGGKWFIGASIDIARALGVSELIIGLTLVAAGTSLPEVVTSLLAIFKGERDIAIGNIVGSNIFNILGIAGVSSLLNQGLEISPAVLYFDLPVMLGVAIACLPIFFTGHRISRWEGFLFLGYYLFYVSYLCLKAAHHDSLAVIDRAMLLFFIPLTVVTLAVLSWRYWQSRRN